MLQALSKALEPLVDLKQLVAMLLVEAAHLVLHNLHQHALAIASQLLALKDQ